MKRITEAVDKHRQLILDAERYLWSNPETGYREVKSSKYMEEHFEALGYELVRAEGITGFYTVIDTGREGPEVLILGELDSVICPSHKDADPVTGAVHSCGHHAQGATLLGIAAALKEPGVLDELCGRIRLCAVPAEELLEIEYRKELKKQGRIRYLGGKSEFLSRGYFDGVDIAFMVHTAGGFSCNAGSVGCIAKNIIYKGKASHAGGSPWNGHNALYAATCGINAANALRETFIDSELVRFHPIITHGGDMVNAIPERVQIESYVRGRTYDAIVKNNQKINRALVGAALSMGTNIEIIDIPGYAPHVNDKNLIDVAKEGASMIGIEMGFSEKYSTGSTDVGDLSTIMPVVQPYAGGARGTSHGMDYEIVDAEAACVTNAKWQLAMLKILLGNRAERAKKVIEEYEPMFGTKEEFLAFQDNLNSSGDRITYLEDGTAQARVN
jgi:amidohydrolase